MSSCGTIPPLCLPSSSGLFCRTYENLQLENCVCACVCDYTMCKSLYLSSNSYPSLIWKMAMASKLSSLPLVLSPPPHCCLRCRSDHFPLWQEPAQDSPWPTRKSPPHRQCPHLPLPSQGSLFPASQFMCHEHGALQSFLPTPHGFSPPQLHLHWNLCPEWHLPLRDYRTHLAFFLFSHNALGTSASHT